MSTWRTKLATYTGLARGTQITTRDGSIKTKSQCTKEEFMNGKCTQTVHVGFWNMLADGLSAGEFMGPTVVDTRDVALWPKRREGVVRVLGAMLEHCDLVGVVENDKYPEVLERLREIHPDVRGVFRAKKPVRESHAYKFGTKNRSEQIVNPKNKQGELTVDDDVKNKLYADYSEQKYINEIDAYRTPSRTVYDDGLTIYYRSDRVQLVNGDQENMMYPLGDPDKRDFHTWTFRRVGGGPDFDVTVAHLASGDVPRNAVQRGNALAEMTRGEFLRPRIMLMDSNFSEHYIDGKGKCDGCTYNNMQLIEDAGLVDVLSSSEGLESFKMRHAAGGQEDKFCDLMFDRIDRILVTGDSITAVNISKPEMYGFKAYDPSAYDPSTDCALTPRSVRP